MHMYADDTQLYVSFSADNGAYAKCRLEDCITEIRQWMGKNHLKLNDSKTEFLVLGNPGIHSQIEGISSISIGSTSVDAAESAKNIGAVLDSQLTMAGHVSNVCRSCYMHLHQISQIRPYLTQDAAATIVHSLITSRLDYVNSLLYGLPEYLIKRLQLVQNNAARLILRKRKHDSATPLLKSLHWLPVPQRIEYKINLLTYKALNNLAPKYLSNLLVPYNPSRSLRSSTKGYLTEKKARLKKAGDRSFSVCGPKLWNKLPEIVSKSDSLESFKVALKTHLFREAY